MYFDFCSFFLILPSTHTVFNFLRVLFLAFSSSLCSLLCFMHICTYMQMIRIISGNFSIILRIVLDLFPRPIFFPKYEHKHSLSPAMPKTYPVVLANFSIFVLFKILAQCSYSIGHKMDIISSPLLHLLSLCSPILLSFSLHSSTLDSSFLFLLQHLKMSNH